MSELSGKVVKILSREELVLNKGRNDGMEEGDYVAVLPEEIEEVSDIDSEETLGGIQRFKISLRVSQVSDHLSIASTYLLEDVNIGGNGLGMAFNFQPPKWVERTETFSSDEVELKGRGVVRVGDEFKVVERQIADRGYIIS